MSGWRGFVTTNAPYLTTGAILTFSSSFGQTFFISIFAGEIRAAYGLSHGGWGAIYTVSTMASAALMLWAGALTDHFRVRRLGPIALGLLFGACLLMALSPTIAVLGFTVFLLRFLGQGMMSHIAYVAMARWFIARRGRAMAITGIGFSFGEAILPLSFVALMGFVDWRVLWAIAALFPIALIPVLYRLLRLERTPQSIAAEDPVPGMLGKYWTRNDALKHPLFWVVFPAIFGSSAFGTAFLFHQVHLAEINGWAHVELVAVFPVYTITAVGFSFVVGGLMDRFGASRLMPFYLLPLVGFFLTVPIATSPIWMIGPLLLLGMLQGASNTLITGFSAEFYGTRHIGGIKSALAAAMVLGSAVGPGLTGWLIDQGMNFEDQMPWIAAYFLCVTAILYLGFRMARRSLPTTA